MTLNKDTRDILKPGDRLKSGKELFTVDRIHDVWHGKQITVTAIEHGITWMKGRRLYCAKLSDFYGYEIIKEVKA